MELKKTVSAGGVVRKKEKGIIFIILDKPLERETMKWVLPKGHVEEGETIEQAAKREVKEETGLENVKLIKKLGIKERKSYRGDEWKTIHYFLFETKDQRELKEVKDEKEILLPQWHEIDDLPEFFWQEQKDLIKENIESIKEYDNNNSKKES